MFSVTVPNRQFRWWEVHLETMPGTGPALWHSWWSCCLRCWLSRSVFDLRKQQELAQVRGPLQPCGRSERNPWLLASAWSSSNLCCYLGRSVSLSLCNSGFQIHEQILNKENITAPGVKPRTTGNNQISRNQCHSHILHIVVLYILAITNQRRHMVFLGPQETTISLIKNNLERCHKSCSGLHF